MTTHSFQISPEMNDSLKPVFQNCCYFFSTPPTLAQWMLHMCACVMFLQNMLTFCIRGKLALERHVREPSLVWDFQHISHPNVSAVLLLPNVICWVSGCIREKETHLQHQSPSFLLGVVQVITLSLSGPQQHPKKQQPHDSPELHSTFFSSKTW